MTKSPKAPNISNPKNPDLKVTVYWGDILYDTAICSSESPVTIGKKENNTFVLDVDYLSFTKDSAAGSSSILNGSPEKSKSIKLASILPDGSAELQFDDAFSGHLKIGSEVLSVASAKKTPHVVQEPDGFYRVKISRTDKADFSVGHVSFYLDWIDTVEILPKEESKEKKKTAFLIVGAILAGLFLVALLDLFGLMEPEKPPERLVVLLPTKPKPVQAKAAMGERKTKDGGSAKGNLGKAKVSKPKRESVAASLAKANLGSLVSGLTSLGASAPSAEPTEKQAAVEQPGAGGFSTEGLKKGGGGKAAGIGRTVGQGEGGFSGTGRLGLSGNSAIEGGTGHGTTETQVRGGLDPDVIESVIKRRLDRIRLCYERELNFHPKLSGKVAINFKIGPLGEVRTARIAEDTMKSSNVNNCILGEVRTWTFPKPEGGTIVNVDYPFVFESSAKAD